MIFWDEDIQNLILGKPHLKNIAGYLGKLERVVMRKILQKTSAVFLCLFMFIIDPSFWFFNSIEFSWLEMNLKKMARANGKMT